MEKPPGSTYAASIVTIEQTFSWAVFLSLVALLLVSTGIFWILVLRDTVWRSDLRLRAWAEDHGFAWVEPGKMPLPDILAPLDVHRPALTMALDQGEMLLLQVQADPPPHRLRTESESSEPARQQYHLLLRRAGGDWRAAALRPAHAMRSLFDYFPLESFPSVLIPERFLAMGGDRRAAASLAGSAAVRLLPPDIGLLLYGSNLVLDFSNRAFDKIEFDRMIAISEQLIRQLPATAAGR